MNPTGISPQVRAVFTVGWREFRWCACVAGLQGIRVALATGRREGLSRHASLPEEDFRRMRGK
jgi:hypothetical protein